MLLYNRYTHYTQYIFRFSFYSVKNSNIVIKAVVLASNTDYYYQFLYLLQHIQLRWWNFNFLSYHLRFIFHQWDRKKMLQYSMVENVKCMFIQILTTKVENKNHNKILNLNDCLIINRLNSLIFEFINCNSENMFNFLIGSPDF